MVIKTVCYQSAKLRKNIEIKLSNIICRLQMDLTHKHNNDFLVGRDIFLNFARIYSETVVYQMICYSIVLKFLFERYL